MYAMGLGFQSLHHPSGFISPLIWLQMYLPLIVFKYWNSQLPQFLIPTKLRTLDISSYSATLLLILKGGVPCPSPKTKYNRGIFSLNFLGCFINFLILAFISGGALLYALLYWRSIFILHPIFISLLGFIVLIDLIHHTYQHSI